MSDTKGNLIFWGRTECTQKRNKLLLLHCKNKCVILAKYFATTNSAWLSFTMQIDVKGFMQWELILNKLHLPPTKCFRVSDRYSDTTNNRTLIQVPFVYVACSLVPRPRSRREKYFSLRLRGLGTRLHATYTNGTCMSVRLLVVSEYRSLTLKHFVGGKWSLFNISSHCMNPFTSICIVKDSHALLVVAKYFAKITHLFLQCRSRSLFLFWVHSVLPQKMRFPFVSDIKLSAKP